MNVLLPYAMQIRITIVARPQTTTTTTQLLLIQAHQETSHSSTDFPFWWREKKMSLERGRSRRHEKKDSYSFTVWPTANIYIDVVASIHLEGKPPAWLRSREGWPCSPWGSCLTSQSLRLCKQKAVPPPGCLSISTGAGIPLHLGDINIGHSEHPPHYHN